MTQHYVDKLEAENERLRDFVSALAQGIDYYETWALAQGIPLTDENVIREYQYIIAGAQATLQASDSDSANEVQS